MADKPAQVRKISKPAKNTGPTGADPFAFVGEENLPARRKVGIPAFASDGDEADGNRPNEGRTGGTKPVRVTEPDGPKVIASETTRPPTQKTARAEIKKTGSKKTGPKKTGSKKTGSKKIEASGAGKAEQKDAAPSGSRKTDTGSGARIPVLAKAVKKGKEKNLLAAVPLQPVAAAPGPEARPGTKKPARQGRRIEAGRAISMSSLLARGTARLRKERPAAKESGAAASEKESALRDYGAITQRWAIPVSHPKLNRLTLNDEVTDALRVFLSDRRAGAFAVSADGRRYAVVWCKGRDRCPAEVTVDAIQRCISIGSGTCHIYTAKRRRAE